MLNGCLQSVSVLISVRDKFVNDSFLGKKPPSCIHEEGFVCINSELVLVYFNVPASASLIICSLAEMKTSTRRF